MEMVGDASTAAYCCMLTSAGELMYGVGDSASHRLIDPQYVSSMLFLLCERCPLCSVGNGFRTSSYS